MQIIERIEIKHFRSFDGGKKQAKVNIAGLQDLNIFSGANDSGKSNVLRALNLFFNNEISPGIQFDIDRDFSKIVRERFDKEKNLRKDKKNKLEDSEDRDNKKYVKSADVVVSIKIYFNNSGRQRKLPDKFWIQKLFSKRNNFKGEYVYQQNIQGSSQKTHFINSFQFEYVPAIKDRNFFQYLFSKLQRYLFEKGDKKQENKFKKSSDVFNTTLEDETKGLFKKFQDSSGVQANFHIPSTMVDFFRTLSVRTENNISLFERGDGVQARFIPDILDEISRGSKKNIIWGFEEPENSYESKNIKKLAEEFLRKHSRDKQVFITSHTKEFLSIKKELTDAEKHIRDNRKLNTKTKRNKALAELPKRDLSSDVSIYRVWKDQNSHNTSFVTKFSEIDNEWEDICDDLGIIHESRIIENLQQELKEITNKSGLEKKKQQEFIKSLEKEHLKIIISYENKIKSFLKPYIFFEDKYCEIYKIAFLKTKGIECDASNFLELFDNNANFTIHGKQGRHELNKFLNTANISEWEDKKALGIFDFDEAYGHFKALIKSAKWNDVEGDMQSGFYISRKGHNNFYSMVLPVPSYRNNNINIDCYEKSELAIELYFSNEVLSSIGHLKYKNTLGGGSIESFKGKKKDLWKKLFRLPAKEFDSFNLIFDKINKLFG